MSYVGMESVTPQDAEPSSWQLNSLKTIHNFIVIIAMPHQVTFH